MREIKFRGKPIEDYGDVNWFYGSAVLDYEDKLAYIVSPGQGHVPVHWESVVQFTGLRDKNGKEIYEGDIVRVRPRLVENQDAFTAPVVWERSGFELNRTIDGWVGYPIVTRLDGMAEEFEVIGNIYENPELLESNNGSH